MAKSPKKPNTNENFFAIGYSIFFKIVCDCCYIIPLSKETWVYKV